MTGSTAGFASAVANIVSALNPIMVRVAPLAMASIFLYFIRSFFD